MAETSDITGVPNRRSVVAGVGVAGLAAALTACGGSGDSATSAGSAGAPAQGGGTASESSSGGAAGMVLAATSAIPSGGGKILQAQKVVVTQPESGTYKAFSAVCPHQGCLVNDVSGGTVNCPCHGSMFSITDGSRQAGPAPRGLTAVKISVEGNEIKLA